MNKQQVVTWYIQKYPRSLSALVAAVLKADIKSKSNPIKRVMDKILEEIESKKEEIAALGDVEKLNKLLR